MASSGGTGGGGRPATGRARALVLGGLGALGALTLPALPAGPFVAEASAAPVTVSVTSSADDGSPGTLRWAVDQVSAAAPGDTVTVEVAAGTYVLSACGAGQDDTNVAGDLDARPGGALAVTAVGGSVTIQQTCVGERVLDVLPAVGAAPGDPSAPVTITGVTITGGNVLGDGGGIRAAGDATLTDVTIEGNTASALPSPGPDVPGTEVHGGGVAAAGTVVVTRGAIRSNTATGGAAATVTTTHSGRGVGGGVQAAVVELTDATVEANAAIGGQGGWDSSFFVAQPGAAGQGGGVAAGQLRSSGSTFIANGATGAGAGGQGEGGGIAGDVVEVTSSTLTGNRATAAPTPGAMCASKGADARGGAIAGGSVLVVSSGLADNEVSAGPSGGRHSSNACLGPTGAGTARGGAVAGETVVVRAAMTHGNRARGGDGSSTTPCVLFSFCATGGGPGIGGSISGQAAVSIEDSRSEDDDAVGGLTWVDPWFGSVYQTPAPAHAAAYSSDGTLGIVGSEVRRSTNPASAFAASVEGAEVTVETSTFGPQLGAALLGTATLSIVSSTVTRDDGSQSLPTLVAPSLSLSRSTLVSSAFLTGGATDLRADALAVTGSLLTAERRSISCQGLTTTNPPAVTSEGGNVVRTVGSACGSFTGPGDVLSSDASLGDVGPLGDHGGPLPTVLPLSDNPAIDPVAGSCEVPTDQRGVARPQGAGCDAGAVEVDGPVTDLVVGLDVATTGPVGPGGAIDLTASVRNDGPVDAPGAFLALTLPGASSSVVVSDGGSCTGLACTWPGPLPNGATRSVSLTTNAPTDGRVVADIAARAGHEGRDPVPADNMATASVAVSASADLAVAVGPFATQIVGIYGNVPVTVTNDGPDAAFASAAAPLVLQVQLPAGVEYRYSPDPCTAVGALVTCTRSQPLAPGATWNPGLETVARHFVVSQPVTASVLPGTTPDPVASNDTAAANVTARNANADLGITTSFTDTLVRGRTSSIPFTVVNNGPDPTPAGFAVDVQLPTGVTVDVAHLASTCTADPAPGVAVRCRQISSGDGLGFAAGKTWNLSIPVVVAVDAPAPAHVMASIGAALRTDGTAIPTADPVSSNNSVAFDAAVRSISANLGVSLALSQQCVCSGDRLWAPLEITADVHVSSLGPDWPVSPFVDLDLPAGSTVVSAPYCTVTAATVHCPVSFNLTPGSTSKTIRFLLAPGTGGQQSVHAHVASSTPDLVPGNDDATVTRDVVPDPLVDVTTSISAIPASGSTPMRLVFDQVNLGPGFRAGGSFMIRLSSGFTSAWVDDAGGASCGSSHLPDGRWQFWCDSRAYDGTGGVPQRVRLNVVRGTGPVRAEITVAPSNDPNPVNNSAVWVPGGPGAASIVGVATRQGTTDVLGGITVSLLSAYPGWSVVATTTTDANGSYRFDGVAPGSYQLRFFDPSGASGRMWWWAEPTYRLSQPVTVAAGATATANQELAPASTGSLHGRALSAGLAPLAGIRVRVFSTTDGYVGGAVTGADGYYQLNGLPAGDYQVQFVDPSHTYLSRWYGGAVNHPNAVTVTVGTGPAWASVVLR